MALAPGTRLGLYEIVAPLGRGGMGEVYRAHDAKLGRDVAVKILPDVLLADPERVARFQREAQLLAALNHPHIAAIYSVEESNAMRFLVLELVEGDTLAERLARGRMSYRESMTIARQVIDALEAAHDKGIIHRDLKPANIALDADGEVKVLDFGLAKATDSNASSDAANSPTLTFAATQMGVILGTAAYMSPEQAKGRGADKRSDVWAFGCVLYEMLAGRRAFEGEDVSDVRCHGWWPSERSARPVWCSHCGLPGSPRRCLRPCDSQSCFRRASNSAAPAIERLPSRQTAPRSCTSPIDSSIYDRWTKWRRGPFRERTSIP